MALMMIHGAARFKIAKSLNLDGPVKRQIDSLRRPFSGVSIPKAKCQELGACLKQLGILNASGLETRMPKRDDVTLQSGFLRNGQYWIAEPKLKQTDDY